MLIAISGSQGCGKTSILTELESRGYNVIKRKFSRSIFNDWGVTLDDVNKNPILGKAFQEEIIKRKYNDELEFTLTSDLVFTERTYSDFFTYTLINFGPYNEYNEWIDGYFDKCKKYTQYYNHVFYIKAKFFNNIKEDGVRSINKHYSLMVDQIMLDHTQAMIYPDSLNIIEETNLAKRIDIILNNI